MPFNSQNQQDKNDTIMLDPNEPGLTPEQQLNRIAYKRALNRRKFIAGLGATGAAVAGAGLLAGCGDTKKQTVVAAGPSETDVLNFALNLEYLEAEFYLRAANGNGLTAADAGTGAGGVTGGAAVPGLTANQQAFINEIAYDEQQHVRFLRTALGSAAVARPVIDFATAFNTLASAATIGAAFNPFADFDSFLVGAFVFEDVGVTAYHGAAGLIKTKSTLTAAAGILATEAYHAAAIRTSLTGRAIAMGASYPFVGFANKVSALRGTLGGGKETPLTVPTSISTPSSIVAADANAVAYARSTDEVLHIVYGTGGGAGVSKGVFFPNGLNGTIKTTAA